MHLELIRAPSLFDRPRVIARPRGLPLMHQSWCSNVFLHWRARPEHLAAMLPPGIELDTHRGHAWMSAVSLEVRGIRPAFLPALPFISRARQVNLRTYVRLDGEPGVWFFSIDCDNRVASTIARRLFHLPYRRARSVELRTIVEPGEPLRPSSPGDLAYFLTERYCVYTAGAKHLYRGRIHHRPWSLRRARVLELPLRARMEDPANAEIHFAEHRDVELWPLERVR